MKARNIFISYSGELDAEIKEGLDNVLKELNCSVINNHPSTGTIWFNELESSLFKSDVVIGILDKANANTYYEIGIAQGMGKRLLLISKSSDEIPDVLKNHKCLFWSKSHEEKLKSEIFKFIQTETSTQSNDSLKNITRLLKHFKNSNDTDFIRSVDHQDFERFTAEIFRLQGWKPSISDPKSHYNFDILLSNDTNKKAIVECKRFDKNKKVSIDTVSQLLEQLEFYDIDYGFIVTTTKFTDSAKEFVKNLKSKKIELWDIETLKKEIPQRIDFENEERE